MTAFHVGSKVQMTEDALENYGEEYAGVAMTVEHVSTKYMAAETFFAKGKPPGFHPGFDSESGDALYDLEGLPFSLYEWELEAYE